MSTTPIAACIFVALACAVHLSAADRVQAAPRFLALGDSYTIGERVDSAARWPVQLAAALRVRGVPIADPLMIARTGWTTDELSAAVDRAGPRGPFALVTLLIGVNDQYRGASARDYEPRFRALLDRAVALAANDARRVLVLSIPDWGATPFAKGRDRERIGREIDDYNNIARRLVTRRGAHFVDITPETREAATNASLVAADGLHPLPAMYAAWTKLALPPALEILGATR